jgi:hypothetical protein
VSAGLTSVRHAISINSYPARITSLGLVLHLPCRNERDGGGAAYNLQS